MPYRTPGKVDKPEEDPSPGYETCGLCQGHAKVITGSDFAWAIIDCPCDEGVTWESSFAMMGWEHRRISRGWSF